jgi:hypothetical protein
MGRSPVRLTPLRHVSLGSLRNSLVNIFSLRTATWLSATVVAAALLGTAGCSSSGAGAGSASVSASNSTLTVEQIVLATTLKHSYQPGGTGAARTEDLTQPDDIVTLGGNLYVGFQNGVGSQGEPSGSGNLDSAIAEFTPAGSVVKQWDVTGKIDGMGADPATGQVIATVNEDSKSSLYTVFRRDRHALHLHPVAAAAPGRHRRRRGLQGEDPDQRVRARHLRQGAGVRSGGVRGHAERRGQDRRGRSVLR